MLRRGFLPCTSRVAPHGPTDRKLLQGSYESAKFENNDLAILGARCEKSVRKTFVVPFLVLR